VRFDVIIEIFDVDSKISIISTSGIASLYNLSTRISRFSTLSIRLLTAPYNVYLICVVFTRCKSTTYFKKYISCFCKLQNNNRLLTSVTMRTGKVYVYMYIFFMYFEE
jgi:hypothetical protein